MLNLTSVGKASKKLSTGEVMRYIPITNSHYDELKKDFRYAAHLKAVDQIDFLVATDGVLLKCENLHDGLKAVVYMVRRMEKLFAKEKSPLYKMDLFASEEGDHFDEYDIDCDDWDEEDLDLDEAASFLYSDGAWGGVPVIDLSCYLAAFDHPAQKTGFRGGIGMAYGADENKKKPYWFEGFYPLVVIANNALFSNDVIESFKTEGRYIFYVSASLGRNKIPEFAMAGKSFLEKKLLFELDFEICELGVPTNQYYSRILVESARLEGYSVSRTVQREKLIEELKRYRQQDFQSSFDVGNMVYKAIKKKGNSSNTLTKKDFAKVLPIKDENEKNNFGVQAESANYDLDRLIGLDDVKKELMRLVKRIKFNKQRKSHGFRTTDMHMAAVFMGNPGTAKTTVARYLGNYLCKERLLEQSSFAEISRKDLIGKYVGWTAPAVAEIFEENKGGTIFIDEAYSLLDEHGAKGFGQEALAEIVLQMENNPDTMVIFGGYKEKMKYFIQNANPGLRSRLTNIIEFPDYSYEEMFEIFCSFVDHEDFVLADKEKVRESLLSFLGRVEGLSSESLGNGRLMRKVFKSTLGYVAERQENDMKTINVSDVQRALEAIEKAEKLVQEEKCAKIGYVR